LTTPWRFLKPANKLRHAQRLNGPFHNAREMPMQRTTWAIFTTRWMITTLLLLS
jgi:hypothetical protein